jgi:hypothetical protein
MSKNIISTSKVFVGHYFQTNFIAIGYAKITVRLALVNYYKLLIHCKQMKI